MTRGAFYGQLLLRSAVTVTEGFIALFAGLALHSARAAIVTSFLLVLLTQANIGSFTMADSAVFPAVLTAGKILYGGPMMGTCVADLSQPILKNNNAILAFSQERAKLPKASNCIQCGRCVNACPLGLAAKDIVVAFNKGNVELLNQLHADLCMSCGTCSFVCPAKRPLTPSIALAKIMMKNGGKK